MRAEIEYLDEFIKFIKEIKRRTAENERKYFFMFVNRRTKNLFFSLWLTFSTNEAERVIIKLQSLEFQKHESNIQKEAFTKLCIPVPFRNQLSYCTSYGAAIAVLERVKISLVEKKYMVRSIDRKTGEIVALKLLHYREAKEGCLVRRNQESIYYEVDDYPVSKLLEWFLQ